jgi:hypothetical protein
VCKFLCPKPGTPPKVNHGKAPKKKGGFELIETWVWGRRRRSEVEALAKAVATTDKELDADEEFAKVVAAGDTKAIAAAEEKVAEKASEAAISMVFDNRGDSRQTDR